MVVKWTGSCNSYVSVHHKSSLFNAIFSDSVLSIQSGQRYPKVSHSNWKRHFFFWERKEGKETNERTKEEEWERKRYWPTENSMLKTIKLGENVHFKILSWLLSTPYKHCDARITSCNLIPMVEISHIYSDYFEDTFPLLPMFEAWEVKSKSKSSKAFWWLSQCTRIFPGFQ